MNLPTTWADALSLTQLAGYAAFAFGMACFAQTDDRRFKLFMALECAAYVLHFALLGQPTAVASTAVSLLRSLASLKARKPWVGVFFVGLSLAAGVWLYQGWVSLLPIAASCIGTTALFFLRGLRMRLLMLCGTLLWLVNNLLVGSVGGSLLEACLAASNLWTILRLRALQRDASAVSPSGRREALADTSAQ
ncbi:MAG: hypothetical protein RJA10_4615 [Pseudomonadota bacterium]